MSDRMESHIGPAACKVTLRGSTLTGTIWEPFGGNMILPHELGEFHKSTAQSRARNAAELFFNVTVSAFPYVLVNGVAVVEPSPSMATFRGSSNTIRSRDATCAPWLKTGTLAQVVPFNSLTFTCTSRTECAGTVTV